MPYVTCPKCSIRSFVLAPWSSMGRCPSCDAAVSVPRQSVTSDLGRKPYGPQRPSVDSRAASPKQG